MTTSTSVAMPGCQRFEKVDSMSSQPDEPQRSPDNLLRLTGIPAHFMPLPPSWPWDVYVIDEKKVLDKIRMDSLVDDPLEVLQRLFDLSDLMLRNKEPKAPDRLKYFAESIENLGDDDRLSCCVQNSLDVRIVDGRALFLDPLAVSKCADLRPGWQIVDERVVWVDPWDEDLSLFGDDPVGWIRNGLRGLDREPLLPRESGRWLVPCRAFSFYGPDWPRCSREPTSEKTPALYIGTRSAHIEIAEWRAAFWFRGIEDGYKERAEALQRFWLQMGPNESELDPVKSFLRNPSGDCRKRAIRFLERAHDAVRVQEFVDDGKLGRVVFPKHGTKQVRGSWAHTGPPRVEENWWRPPVEGSLEDLAGAIGVSPRTIRKRNTKGAIWVLCVHAKKYQVWFKTKHEYDAAQKKMPK